MDRSFLSQPEVVRASRKFVCIRLATYEDAQEARLLTSLFVGGSGQLENTTFAILSPDGQRPLVRSGRSPDFAFRDAADMATQMDQIARQFGVQPGPAGGLPALSDFRLAVNVAACENQLLLVLVRSEGQSAWESRFRQLAWEPELRGRVVLCVERPGRLASGLWILRPDTYGQKARALVRLDPDARHLVTQVCQWLKENSLPAKDVRSHIAEGNRRGVYWQTKIPVTDPGGPP